MRSALTICSLVLALSACSDGGLPRLGRLPGPSDLPFIHKLDIQQGNVITQDMLAQLKPGMEKKKVLFIMGTPIIQDTFNADRWDYLYTFEPGGEERSRRSITLRFVDEKLHHIVGDVKPAEAPLVATLHQDTSVKVPKMKRKTLTERIVDKIPFTGDDNEQAAAEDEENEPQAAADDESADADDAENESDTESSPLINVIPVSPYENIQAGPGEGIVVPPDAPTHRKKKGFFARLFSGEDDEDEGDSYLDEDKGDTRPSDRPYQDDADPGQL